MIALLITILLHISCADQGSNNVDDDGLLMISRDKRVIVTSDVRGNLGPVGVIIQNPPGTDWLKDRWQAASDMGGTAIAGKHWIEMDFNRFVGIVWICMDVNAFESILSYLGGAAWIQWILALMGC